MRGKRYVTGCLMLLILVGFSAIAQNAADDLRKMSRRYASVSGKMQVQMNLVLYPTHNATTGIETKKVRVSVWGTRFRMQTEGIEVIRNDRYNLYANTSQKVIILEDMDTDAFKKETAEIQQWMNMDSLLKMYNKVELIKDTLQTRIYRLYNNKKGSKYAYVDIRLNTGSFLMEKITVYYARKLSEVVRLDDKSPASSGIPRLEIAYTNYVFPKTEPVADFSVSKYITMDKSGKKQLAKSYADFKFMDYTMSNQK